MSDKCRACGQVYSPSCDWNQGRCPWHEPTFLSTMPEYYLRYLNLGQSIKNFFNRFRKDR
jgi:hypothetical protein